jgi:formate dehydrogenase maturation protein FdhE
VKERPNGRSALLASFERRAARAELLAPTSEAAEAPLRFAAGLYRAGGAFVATALTAHERRALSGELVQDICRAPEASGPTGLLRDALRSVLRFAASHGPPELSAIAAARLDEGPPLFDARLRTLWAGETDGRSDYLARALVRPYLEMLAALRIEPQRERRAGRCPFCGGAPWIASRRAQPNADGAERWLGCAYCGTEWMTNRLRCPVCAEENPDKLPSFRSDRHPAARIEACENCRYYVKSLDLTIDARLVPEVDDLVSLAMDLWAAEQGFTRVEPGLAGV